MNSTFIIYLSFPAILAIILGVILFAALLLVLFYFFIFSKYKIKKSFKELERKYSYLDALLIGQDSQYIHRLEIISRTNLLFADKYLSYSQRFKEIFDGDDKFLQSLIKQINSLILNNEYKNARSVLFDAKKALKTFEDNVTIIDQELYAIIKPEEDARQAVLQLKEKYRRVKSIYYSSCDDLTIAENSFNTIFPKLDNYFLDFESKLERGEYEEANSLLELMDKVISSLDNVLKELPILCIRTINLIPQKIIEISKKYSDVEKQGVPLFNLGFKGKINAWNSNLKNIEKKLAILKIASVSSELDVIEKDIALLEEQIIKELSDKEVFLQNCDSLYAKAIELEKSFVKICSILPMIRETYFISNEQENKITYLSESIQKLGSSKRNLDNFVHSSISQPFSILNEKLDDLRSDYEIAYEGVQKFKNYLDSLKRSCEDAYAMIYGYYARCKEIEKLLKEIDIDKVSEEFEIKLECCYELLNSMNLVLGSKPINVERINEMIEELKETGNSCFDEVENKYHNMKLAESSIVFGNRDRNHQSEIHQQFIPLEKMFFDGHFNKVYNDATNIYSRLHIEEETNKQ